MLGVEWYTIARTKPEERRDGMAKPQEGLRDHFAGLAMAALITSRDCNLTPDFIAKQSYEYADAMLKESESNQPPKKEIRYSIP